MTFVVVPSFLRCTCCLEPWFPTPWRPVGFVRCLSPTARSLQAPYSTESLVGYFPAKVPLRRASLAWRVTIIPAAPNFCHGPKFPWVRYPWRCFFYAMSLLQSETTSCRRQPTSSGIHNLLECFVASRVALQLYVALGRFFRSLAGFTMAFSMGTSDIPLWIPIPWGLAVRTPDMPLRPLP
jgi:hypothetical protein